MLLLENNQSNTEKSRRKMLLNIALILVAVCGLFAAALVFWLTQPLFLVGGAPKTARLAESENLKNHVRMLSETLAPRGESLSDNLNRKADYIRQEFEKTGAKVSEQVFTVNNVKYRNVIASIGTEPQGKIIIGAHYDTAGGHAGADDNSSGVAGLLELARLLRKADLLLQIELVAYALEEPPYFGTTKMGSYFHAKSLYDNGEKVRLMICLEMIGYFSDAANTQNYPVSVLGLLYPSKGNFVAVVGNFGNGLTTRQIKFEMQKAVETPVYSINAPAFIEGVDFSDHRNYWQFGYNAVMLTDTAFYRNKNYHTHQDTWEKLDYAQMARVVDATFAAVDSLK
jgi:Zn-dependent M28 family amino/carboxypeptidase